MGYYVDHSKIPKRIKIISEPEKQEVYFKAKAANRQLEEQRESADLEQKLLRAKQKGKENWEALLLRVAHQTLSVGRIWPHTNRADLSPDLEEKLAAGRRRPGGVEQTRTQSSCWRNIKIKNASHIQSEVPQSFNERL